MKKIMSIAIGLMCGAAWAGEVDRQIITATSGSTATSEVTATSTTIRGYLEQIDIVVPSTKTGTVWLVATPELSGMADVTLVAKTNANGNLIYRPRAYATDSTGAELGTNAPQRYALCGDTVKLCVSNASATNITFKAIVKFERR